MRAKDTNQQSPKSAYGIYNKVNGNVRLNQLEKPRMGDRTYTKYFGENGGITVETITNNATNLVPTKQFVPLKINPGLRK